MEYFPFNLIILWKKISCYTWKWNVSAFRRVSGQCRCGNTHVVFLLFSWFLPRLPQSFLPPHLAYISQSFLYFTYSLRCYFSFSLAHGRIARFPCLLPYSYLSTFSPSFRAHQASCLSLSPSMCQPYHAYSFYTCLSLQTRIFFSQISAWLPCPTVGTFSDHPQLKCLSWFLHRICDLLKLSY